MKSFLKPSYWPKILAGLLILAQVVLMVGGIFYLNSLATDQSQGAVMTIVAILFVADLATLIFIINTRSPNIYKITWSFFVVAIPVAGIVLYFLFANKNNAGSNRKKFKRVFYPIQSYEGDKKADEHLRITHPGARRITKYLTYSSGGQVEEQTSVVYYSLVDYAFEPILEELKKAKHYIFLEFFIFSSGVFWDSILEVLESKVKEGVDVRVIYDDVGCLGTLPSGYADILKRKGIKTICYNPLRPFLDIRMNNRDHRKIMVIDGHTCFSGGFNIADEYVNKEVRFGHWKDNAILIKGKAVYSFTLMFLANWAANSLKKEDIDKDYYRPETFIDEIGGFPKSNGYVQPYTSLPFDDEAVGERVYLQILQRAKHYVYITTPYLIISEEMENALMHAAKSGVDVRLLTPHIPDKNIPFHIARSFYGNLIKAGVKVYEYTPGFVHAKTFVSDDHIAAVGTINLDYRSLYLHLECGTLLIDTPCVKDMKEDLLSTYEASHLVSLEEWERWRRRNKGYWAMLRIIAPML